MTEPRSSGRALPPHVVMVVGNDVTTDNRVRRTALALARAGARVTVLGTSPDAERHESALEGVRVVRVPVDWRLRDARTARLARRRARRLPFIGYADSIQAHAARVLPGLRAVGPDGSPAVTAVRRAGWSVRGRLVGARLWAGKRQEAARERLWRGWDRRRNASERLVSWQRELPEVFDIERAFGPVLDAMRPDVVHAHDVQVVSSAARAVARARAAGRTVRWVYDAHEWVPGLSEYRGRTRRVIAAWADLEAEHIRDAAAVVTVSPQLAHGLEERYDLGRTPAVVLNIPEESGSSVAVGIRAALGLGPDVPLLVYSGGVRPARGVQTAVAALAELPDAHLAVVAVPHRRTGPVAALEAQARSLGVADRLHLVDPVAPHLVSSFVASADVGLIPLLHYGSHEMALTNKLFEYLHAGLPVVVSDCIAQAEFVAGHGIGLVHRAGDPSDLARALRTVLAGRDSFVRAGANPELRSTYTWAAQAAELVDVYRGLLGDARLHGTPDRLGAPQPAESRRAAPPSSRVLAVGPTNSAGQGWAWTRAAAQHVDGVAPEVVAIRNHRIDFAADTAVEPETFARDRTWGLALTEEACTRWTHALLESGRPVLGRLNGGDFRGDARLLREAGVEVGLVFHGSDLRDPRRHAAAEPHSPFRDAAEPLTARLQQQIDALRPHIDDFDGPLFVSTLDLLDDLPPASWLPVVVDLAGLPAAAPPLRRGVPVVVHAPSNAQLKGSDLIDRVLESFAADGRITYRRLTDLPPDEVLRALADADIVVDQVLLGIYGVLACEAMALGRVTVSHVGEPTRRRTPQPLPVIEAGPETLRAVIDRVLEERQWAQDIAASGPAYVREVHDGRRTAEALAPFLGRVAPRRVTPDRAEGDA